MRHGTANCGEVGEMDGGKTFLSIVAAFFAEHITPSSLSYSRHHPIEELLLFLELRFRLLFISPGRARNGNCYAFCRGTSGHCLKHIRTKGRWVICGKIDVESIAAE
jgi:hypothetical protein